MATVADADSIVVVGAGIAGLAAAILLARDHACKVVVYDLAVELSQKPEESYPIGVNPRGLRVLDMINPALREEINLAGMVAGWSINNGDKEVAALASGVVVGTTRGQVIAALYREAVALGTIQFNLGHKLTEFDAANHVLRFDSNGTEVEVDASKARILDGTGCWSKIRSAMEKGDEKFNVETYAWGTIFRNLFTNDEPTNCPLDPQWHYIFSTKMSGIYGALLTGKRWVFSVGCDQVGGGPWMLENEATPENITQLKDYVAEKCPKAAVMLEEEEYGRFFSRRTFTGQVVKVSKLNQGEKVVLLGDAAHAVIPATGEGTNAALEDVSVLIECLRSSKELDAKEQGWFESYNTQRLPDSHALSDYARHLASGAHVGPAEKNRRTANFICVEIVRKMKIYGPTWNELTFGPAATLCTPYREAFANWQSQSSKIRGFSNFIAWFANRNVPEESVPVTVEQ